MTTLPSTNISLSNVLTFSGVSANPPFSMSNTSLITNFNTNNNVRPFALGFFRGKSRIAASFSLSNEVFTLLFGSASIPTADSNNIALTTSGTPPTMSNTAGRGHVLHVSGSSFLYTTSDFTLPASYTKACWIYPLSGTQGYGNLISTYDTSNNSPLHYVWYNNSSFLSAGHNNSITAFVSDPQAIVVNNWTHYAFTYDNTTQTMVLYRNGVNVHSATNANLSWSGSVGRLGIGTYLGGNVFNGFIDDVRIFSRALSAADVNALYETTMTLAIATENEIFSLLYGTTTLPTIDTYGAALLNSTTLPTIVNTSIRGRVMNTAGTSFTYTTNNITLGASYTKMCWIYPFTAVQGTNGNVISIYSGPTDHYMWFNNTTNMSAGHQGSGGGAAYVTDPVAIVASNWVHYAVTYNNTTQTMILYRNGFAVNSNTSANMAWSGVTGQLGIGTFKGGNIFNGYIDDARVMNRALPPEHVYYIFAKANPVPPLDQLTSAAPVAAYNLKLMTSNYTGPIIRLRRSSDNAVQDFYTTTTGILTTGGSNTGTTYPTWIGANTAFVDIWYDQTGRGKHVSQSTMNLQPTLVNDGAAGYTVYCQSNRCLIGPNVFDVTSTNNMHMVMSSREMGRLENVLISLHGGNIDIPRFFIHAPYPDGRWYWDALNFGNNRAQSAVNVSSVGQKVTFSGHKGPGTSNGFRINGGTSYFSTANTAVPCTGGIRINTVAFNYFGNHYVYGVSVFNSRLSAGNETIMESLI